MHGLSLDHQGRDPHPDRRSGRAWEFEAEDVIAAQWARQWPKQTTASEATARLDRVAAGRLEVEPGEIQFVDVLNRR